MVRDLRCDIVVAYIDFLGEVVFIAFKPIAKMAAIAIGGMILCRKGILSHSTHVCAKCVLMLLLLVGILSPEATKANAGLILNMLLPMLTFASVVSSFDPSNMRSFAALLITGVTYMTMGLSFGFLVRTLTPVPKTWRSGVLITGGLLILESRNSWVDSILGACSNWGDLTIAFVLTIAKGAPFNGESDVSFEKSRGEVDKPNVSAEREGYSVCLDIYGGADFGNVSLVFSI
jgi:hypothetical protein